MSLWGRNVQTVTANSSTTAETSTGQPLYGAAAVNVKGAQLGVSMSANSHFGNTSAGSRANVDVLIYANDTPSAFINNMATGIFGVTPLQMSNNIANSTKERPAHAGWVIRRAGVGGIATATKAAVAGSGFANGETIKLSNGTSNAVLTVTTNSSGNMVSLAVSDPGQGWINTTMVANTFNREKYVANVKITTPTGLGYDNTSILVLSNGSINAVSANLTTNATGGITSNVTMINVGLFPNAITNAQIKVNVTKYDGTTAVGNTTWDANIIPQAVNSSGGGFTITLGGRAGRVQTETLVAAGSLGAQSAAYGTPATSNGLNAGTVSQVYYPGI